MKIGIKNLPNKSKRPLVFFLPESDFERTIIQEIQNLNIHGKLWNYIKSIYEKSRFFKELIDNHIYKYKTCKDYNANQRSAEILSEIIENFMDNDKTLYSELIANIIYKNFLSYESFKEDNEKQYVIDKIYVDICWITLILCLETITETPFFLEYYLTYVLYRDENIDIISVIDSIHSATECDDK